MLSNSSFQNGPVQKPGTTARSRQISTSVRPSGRRRTCASSSSSVGMNSSGSFQPAGRDGRGTPSARQAPRPVARPVARPADGRRRGRALARCGEADIPAPRRACEQHALQRRGAQDAALQVREDRIQPAGAEADRDGVEVGAGGAMRRGLGEMAAVAEQDANGVQQCGDARGHGPPRRGRPADPVGDRVKGQDREGWGIPFGLLT